MRTLAEAKEAAERLAQRPPEPALDPELRARLADLGHRLPELWESGRLSTEHQKGLLTRLRRRLGQQSPLKRLRNQEKVDGYWTVHGLARELGVDRHWIYSRIVSGSLPATHYRQSSYYVIPDDPELLAEFERRAGATFRFSRSFDEASQVGG